MDVLGLPVSVETRPRVLDFGAPRPCTHLEVHDVTDQHLLAALVFEEATGEIVHLWTKPECRRRGFATALWDIAEALGAKHSQWRTIDGQAWAQAVSIRDGQALPEWRLS